MDAKKNEQEIKNRNPVCVAIGKSLKNIRISKKLSQAELAFLADVDRTFVSHIERGMTNPTATSLAMLCFALDVTLADLFASVQVSMQPPGQAEAGVRKVLPTFVPPQRRLR